MSEVALLMKSGLMVALKAIRFPSGAHENEPTLKSFPFVRCAPVTGAFRASAKTNVQICEWLYSFRTTSKSPRCSLRSLEVFESRSLDAKAISRPSYDQT